MKPQDKGDSFLCSYTANAKLAATGREETEELTTFFCSCVSFPEAIDYFHVRFETPPFFAVNVRLAQLTLPSKISFNALSAKGLFLICNEQLRFFNGDSLLHFDTTDAATIFGSEADARKFALEVKARQKRLCFELPDKVKVQEWNRLQDEAVVSGEILRSLEKAKRFTESEHLPILGEYTPAFFAERHNRTPRNIRKRMEEWAKRPRKIDYMPLVFDGTRWRITEPQIAKLFDDFLRQTKREKS